MPLASLLTRARLRERADGRSFQRGEQYWREERVVEYDYRRADDAVVGVVQGTHAYRVAVLARGRSFEGVCSCPMGDAGAFCKHAVALALYHVERESAPRAKAARRDDAATDDSVFANRTELDAFAAAHHVEHELARAAVAIMPALEARRGASWDVRRALSIMSLRDIGSLPAARERLAHAGRDLAHVVAAVVKQRLVAAADDVAGGLAEEHARVAPELPRESAAARWWAALVQLRRAIRTSAWPRSREARTRGRLHYRLDELAIEWLEPDALRGPNFMAIPVIAQLRSPSPDAYEPRVECTCRAAACTHGLALIDAVLDRLAAGDAEAREAADELMRPPWQRALAALAELDAAPRTPAEIELWWEIEEELGAPTATAIVKRRRRGSGTFSTGTRMTAARLLREHGAALDARDRSVAELLDAWRAAPVTSYPARAFAALVEHPRVLYGASPIAVHRVALGVTVLASEGTLAGSAAAGQRGAIDDGGRVRLEPSIEGMRLPPRELAARLATHVAGEPMLVIEPQRARVLLVDVADEARRLWAILAKHGDSFPPEAHAQLFARLAQLEAKVPVAVPPELLGERVPEATVVVLRLRLTPDVTLELEPFVRPADGAPIYAPGVGPRDVLITQGGRRSYVRRTLAREHELVAAALARLPLETAEEGPPGCYRLAEPDAALAVVAVVQSPPPGIVAEWIDQRARVVPSGDATSLRVAIDTRRDWFGITGQLAVEQGRVELAVLLDAARRQQRFVRLDEHRWVELESTLRARLADLADRTFESRGEVELSIAAAPAVRALADDGAAIAAAPAWQTLAKNLASAHKLRPKPPAALKATLRPYQVDGHAWLARLAAWGAGGCLADDMGLGKTVQAIALLLDRAKRGPAIVLAPTSVALNWVDELKKFAPSLRAIVYGQAADRGKTLAALGAGDILIASYGLLQRDHAALAAVRFATLVADEAQALKNPRTERAKAARALAADFRIALSGTPLENHLGELWSLFALVFPGLLGSWEQFRTRFASPIEKNQNTDASAALARVIKPFLLRRTKQEVAPELPPRTEIHVPVALSTAEAELYEDARLAAVARLGKLVPKDAEQRRFEVLAALTRLRLLASHPKLYDQSSSVASSKMQRLLELVAELRSEGHRALVFSQFTSHLGLVRAVLEAAGVALLYLDGATPARERARLIDRFQHGEADVFLISLKAGGTGINLTGADYVIHLDPWWNPAVEDQATDRAHRIGQDKPVTVYRLIARDTVEEKILAMHGTKRALVAGVLAGTDAAARITTRDLVDLIAAQ